MNMYEYIKTLYTYDNSAGLRYRYICPGVGTKTGISIGLGIGVGNCALRWCGTRGRQNLSLINYSTTEMNTYNDDTHNLLDNIVVNVSFKSLTSHCSM